MSRQRRPVERERSAMRALVLGATVPRTGLLMLRATILGLLLSAACVLPRPPSPPARSAPPPALAQFRLHLCSEAPVHLEGPPGAQQSRGCVATFVQKLSDPATIRALGVSEVRRRYLVYAPATLPPHPVAVVLVFPGYSASAEAAAFYYTHTRFEALADRDGFVVVYGNGLPHPPDARERVAVPQGGFLRGCLAEHAGEGV